MSAVGVKHLVIIMRWWFEIRIGTGLFPFGAILKRGLVGLSVGRFLLERGQVVSKALFLDWSGWKCSRIASRWSSQA